MSDVLSFRQPRRLFAAGRIAPRIEVLDLTIPQHDVEAFELMVEAMRMKYEQQRAIREVA